MPIIRWGYSLWSWQGGDEWFVYLPLLTGTKLRGDNSPTQAGDVWEISKQSQSGSECSFFPVCLVCMCAAYMRKPYVFILTRSPNHRHVSKHLHLQLDRGVLALSLDHSHTVSSSGVVRRTSPHWLREPSVTLIADWMWRSSLTSSDAPGPDETNGANLRVWMEALFVPPFLRFPPRANYLLTSPAHLAWGPGTPGVN